MRAVVIAEPSAAPAVADVPDPVAAAGQVLVRVAASSINGFDVAVAAGRLVGMMEHRYPVVLGKDFAGVVEAVGEGSQHFSIGDRVFGVVMAPYLGAGGMAELLVVDEAFGIALLPDEVSDPVGGALGLAGAAAVGSVDPLDLQPGQTVLVVGATGGVGSLVVQYAAAAGAMVIATAATGRETDFVTDLGAHHTVDPAGDVAAQVAALAPSGVQAVVHLAGDPGAVAGVVAAGGRLVSTLGFGPDQHPAATAVMASPDRTTLERLATDVAAGRIRVPITTTATLDEAPAAVAAFASGTLGKHGVLVR